MSVDGDELEPDVHIHHPRHTVVHVHRENVTWDRFFSTLGFTFRDPSIPTSEWAELTLPDGRRLVDGEGGSFKFWINGVRVIGVADLNIRSMQRVLISFGPESEETVIAEQLPLISSEACIPGQLCPERGSGEGEYGEPCSGTGTSIDPR